VNPEEKHRLECDLFGYEKNAFVGAERTTRGRFELADKGTLYLNEVGALTPDLQAKLLRTIESSHISRMGSSTEIKVDVRVLAGTTFDLEADVKLGRFREDLYFRLNVIPTAVPPLRDYKTDIPLISRRILDKAGFIRARFNIEALSFLKDYQWPGNLRQLEEVVVAAANVSNATMITTDYIQNSLEQKKTSIDTRIAPGKVPAAGERLYNENLSYRDHIIDFERRLLKEILETSRGNITKAAAMLDTDRGNLSKKIKKLGIKDTF